jgi:hypothetical protein
MYDMVRYTNRLLALALLVGLACPVPGAAQDAAVAAEASNGPLLKVDLVRMLAVGDYTDAELAHIVQMSCVVFQPSERDRNDILSLLASSAAFRLPGPFASRTRRRISPLPPS